MDVEHLVVTDDVNSTVNNNLLSLLSQLDVLNTLRIDNASLTTFDLNNKLIYSLQATNDLSTYYLL